MDIPPEFASGANRFLVHDPQGSCMPFHVNTGKNRIARGWINKLTALPDIRELRVVRRQRCALDQCHAVSAVLEFQPGELDAAREQ